MRYGSITGSITKTSRHQPYITAGENVFITTGSSGNIVIGVPKVSTSPGGDFGQIQYNSGSSLGGTSCLTFDGENLFVTGSFQGDLTGSLTRLYDGSSYIVAGKGIDVSTGSNGSVTISSTCDANSLQGNALSSKSPVPGQVLTWDGSTWIPGGIPTGGSGGGGLTYFLNDSGANESILSKPARLLDTVSSDTGSSITSTDIPTGGAYDVVACFVTLSKDIGSIVPAGIWDFNVWASLSVSQVDDVSLVTRLYRYDGNETTLISSSPPVSVYDPSTPTQYVASMTVPQTSVSETDRLLVTIEATAVSRGIQVTVYTGESRPSHVHTTIPSVKGTGFFHVVNGVVQPEASSIDLTSDVTGILSSESGGTGLRTSGTDVTKFLGSDGAGGWRLTTPAIDSSTPILSMHTTDCDYDIKLTDCIVFVNCQDDVECTLRLPAAGSCKGKLIYVRNVSNSTGVSVKTSAGTVEIDGNVLEGEVGYKLTPLGERGSLRAHVSDGYSWWSL